MRIAQVAPLYESVPPLLYGGTERVVWTLTEELVRQGHEVVLFASGDSRSSATLIAPCERALRLDEKGASPLAYHVLLLKEVFRRAEDFDVVHFHIDYLHFPFSEYQQVTDLTTLHGRLDLPELIPLYHEFPRRPLISISDSQREPLPWANWRATIYHGINDRLYRLQPNAGKYLAFLGRISPEKRLDRAIEIAKRAGIPLKIAAKVDAVDAGYFESAIRPLLDHPLIEYIGEIGDAEKQAFLGDAAALLFPIDWPEPFGLAMVEAMACGTPVVAFRRGSVPEVVDEGVTGLIVDTIEEGVLAVQNITLLDRRACRARFEQRFTAEQMANQYVAEYARLMDEEFDEPRLQMQ